MLLREREKRKASFFSFLSLSTTLIFCYLPDFLPETSEYCKLKVALELELNAEFSGANKVIFPFVGFVPGAVVLIFPSVVVRPSSVSRSVIVKLGGKSK